MANRKVPRDVEAVVNKCLEKNPARRYPNGRALAADISTFLEGGKLELTTQSRMKQLITAAKANAPGSFHHRGHHRHGIVSIVARSMFNTRDAGPLVEQGITALKENPQNDDRSSKSLSGFSRTPSRWSQKWQSLPGSGHQPCRRGIDKNTHRVLNPKFVEEAFKANDTPPG